MTDKKTKIGILSAGGDCPGINAAIRGVGKTAIVQYGMEVIGISNGFSGLIDRDYEPLTEDKLSGILTLGGTILGTSRMKPFKPQEGDTVEDKPQVIIENYELLGLDALVCIGGNGTQKTANLLSKEGLNVVGIPKTIDNDVWGTDVTFGFDSAVNIATDAIDRLHTTANSHKRVMVIEVMGHNAGWIALHSGLAAGGDVILLPEMEYDMDVVAQTLLTRAEKGKPYSIVVVGEGIGTPGKKNAARYISKEIMDRTGLETRETILGYIQRGGSPSPADRILATRYGAYAASLIHEKKFGTMVSIKGGEITSVPLEEVGGKTRLIEPGNHLVEKAVNMGVCFGK
ncbi:6-phosphofructokinase [Plebeiibacterium sediminum]|uniref:ATP-dependent 6-phosphofructokinase n=1 Tax=Plebeiibacterium sediminum TaxID=2992112 RepID=A0AAE3M9I6_9BACT|nr:ATP-dependent 6-phosphofructokinase [Plebeiobacterium sediminum]MCW3789085.1 6-phosphofructokinase [Plebeiobacterium sediminum]